MWPERYTEARWGRAFAKLDLRCFGYSDKSKEIGRHSYQRQVLQRKLLVLVHSEPLKDRPGAKVLSPGKFGRDTAATSALYLSRSTPQH